jgi:hypothetical protein
MKILSLILAMGLLASGCAATFQHSELITTDPQGNAVGRYSCDSQGKTGTWLVAGTGGGWGGAPGAGGLGGVAIYGETGPPKVNAVNFAKSVTMINYSKKLKSIKYDETSGIVEYEFEGQPAAKTTSKKKPAEKRSSLPASFGHQPIE